MTNLGIHTKDCPFDKFFVGDVSCGGFHGPVYSEIANNEQFPPKDERRSTRKQPTLRTE